MDVPVTILGDVRGDGATEPVPREALVLVGEDVRAVPTQALGDVSVGLSLPHERKRLGVIVAHGAGDVVMQETRVTLRHVPAHSTGEGSLNGPGDVVDGLLAVSAGHDR